MNQLIRIFLSALAVIGLNPAVVVAQDIGPVPIRRADTIFIADYAAWNDYYGYPSNRNKLLDSMARLRCQYFIELLQHKKGWKFIDLLDSIPHGRAAHRRYFGRPTFYSEPPGSRYTAVIGKVPGKNIQVNAEIMTESVYSYSTSRKIADDTLVRSLYHKLLDHFGEHFIIRAYLRSDPHRKAMEKYGHDLFGTSTLMLVRKTPIGKKTRLEMLIYNLTVFGR